MGIRTLVWMVGAGFLAAAALALPAETDRDATAWGEPFNGLQTSLYASAQGAERFGLPAIRLAMRNVGSRAFSVDLGVACGVASETNSITLILSYGTGRSQKLHDASLDRPCGGRFMETSVPLAPGSYFSTPIPLAGYGYRSSDTGEFLHGWEAGGTYSLRAEIDLDAGIKALKPFDSAVAKLNSVVTSNQLNLQFPAQSLGNIQKE
ncbi:MAG TPA: hypothetical protein VNU84_00795 [Candidatus Acidoferrum sp.]|jgi:hypothetical protein|nr:hypothetical protein [Candidatus Acidoferrum sp.]